MRISKIQAEPTETVNNEQSFKALKLRTSTLARAKRTLKQDTLELRKNLPDNKESKVNKYFGQPADPNAEVTDADVIVGLGAIAVGLGLAFL